MIKLDPGTQGMLHGLRLEQMSSAIRRNVLTSAGRKAAKVVKPALKRAEKGKATGTLEKNLDTKVKAYAGTNTVFIVGGAKSKKIQVSTYKDYLTGQMRTWKKGQPKKGPKYQNPAKYSHLAGPGRGATNWVNVTRKNVLPTVQKVIVDTIEAEVFRR